MTVPFTLPTPLVLAHVCRGSLDAWEAVGVRPPGWGSWVAAVPKGLTVASAACAGTDVSPPALPCAPKPRTPTGHSGVCSVRTVGRATATANIPGPIPELGRGDDPRVIRVVLEAFDSSWGGGLVAPSGAFVRKVPPGRLALVS